MAHPPENIHSQLMEDVRDIDRHPILAKPVSFAISVFCQLTAVKIHHAHLHRATGRCQPQQSATRMRRDQMPPATGDHESTVGDADVMPAVSFLTGAPFATVRKGRQERDLMVILKAAQPTRRAEPRRAIPHEARVPETGLHHLVQHFTRGRPPTREVLDEMVQARFWHPRFMWYGPAGLGTTRGLRGFEDYHQIPFLAAFPDRGKRRAGEEAYSGHYIRIADGRFVVTGGWGHLVATHTGGGLLGLAATGRTVKMRVMDFYRCELAEDGDGERDWLRENWVPIDIPHVLHQLGVDIFGRMRHQHRQNQALRASEFLVR